MPWLKDDDLIFASARGYYGRGDTERANLKMRIAGQTHDGDDACPKHEQAIRSAAATPEISVGGNAEAPPSAGLLRLQNPYLTKGIAKSYACKSNPRQGDHWQRQQSRMQSEQRRNQQRRFSRSTAGSGEMTRRLRPRSISLQRSPRSPGRSATSTDFRETAKCISLRPAA